MSQKGRQERVRMRSVRRRLLGGNLPTLLSILLEISPYSQVLNTIPGFGTVSLPAVPN